MKYLTHAAHLQCCHGGTVTLNAPGARSLRINGSPVVCVDDLEGAMVEHCLAPAPLKPCDRVLSVLMGRARHVGVDGRTPLLQPVLALTNGSPPGTCFAIDDGKSVMQIRAGGGRITPGDRIGPPARPRAPDRSWQGWIGLRVHDERNAPLEREWFRLFLVDGSSFDGRLRDDGATRVERIPEGTCGIVFPHLCCVHTVRAGETLSGIAQHFYGTANWHKIWEHPYNAAFRAQHEQDPNRIHPSDEIFIPAPLRMERQTGAVHTLAVARLKINMVIRLSHNATQPEAWDDTCRLWTTDDDGATYDQTVPLYDQALTRKEPGLVQVLFKGVLPDLRYSCFLDLGKAAATRSAGGFLVFAGRRLTAEVHVPALPVAVAREYTRADWHERALSAAGIRAKEWLPERGFAYNSITLEKVYSYYARLYLDKNPNLLWAALAKLAGGEVYRGLQMELEPHLLAAEVARDTAVWAEPGEQGHQAALEIKAAYALLLQVRLLEMQKAIFDDLAWQHQAFVEKGFPALEAVHRQGELSAAVLEAWRGIAAGALNKVREGNYALLFREQYEILQGGAAGRGHYRHIQDIRDFNLIPRLMSDRALSPVPGGKPFREIVSGGDITVFTDRWHWIRDDMIPAFERLDAAKLRHLVGQSLAWLAQREFDR